MDNIDSQPFSILVPMEPVASGISIAKRDDHFLNAPLALMSTLSGMMIADIALRLANAKAPMLETPSPISTRCTADKYE